MLGCQQWPAVLIGMGFGLSCPAFTYATLFYGHNTSAFFAFLAYSMLVHGHEERSWPPDRMFLVGLAAGFAVAIEYVQAFFSVGLCAYAVWSGCRISRLWPMLLGGLLWASFLAGYHTLAYGGPFTFGYQFVTEFQHIYTEDNPVGLTLPKIDRAAKILFSPHGLVWYAPLTCLAPFGVLTLINQRRYKELFVIALAFGSFFLVNASHPTWTGGWTTGPRYLLPALPFLMLAVAAFVSGKARWRSWLLAAMLLAGFLICLGCTACGGRLPDVGDPGGDNPLVEVVLPRIWKGQIQRNVGNLIMHGGWDYRGEQNWAALLPLLDFLILMLILIGYRLQRHFENSQRACGFRS